jgi:hypothetical protein
MLAIPHMAVGSLFVTSVPSPTCNVGLGLANPGVILATTMAPVRLVRVRSSAPSTSVG